MLKLIDVSKHYDQGARQLVKALDNVSVSVGKGEFVVVEGPSGCGKTTLLLVAGGLLHPSEGIIQIGDKNIYSMRAAERAAFRAEKIGFVFQQFHLISYLSVLENVLAPSLALNEKDSLEVRARDLLSRFELNSRIDHLPSELSTGERQRVSLARALLNKPELLLADEPTGNLDRENAEIVIASLADFAQAGGAVLMVTHSREASIRGDKVVHLKGGCLTNLNGGNRVEND